MGDDIRRLCRHSSHYAAGLLGGMAVGLVSFPIFTRVFSVAEYGLIDLALRVTLLLTPLAKLGLQNSAIRFYDGKTFEGDRNAARAYYSTLFFGVGSTAAAALLLFAIVALVAGDLLLGHPFAALLWVVCGLVFVRGISSMLWSFLRVEERTVFYNFTSVASRAAGVAAVCALFPWTGRTAGTYFAGILVAEAAVAVWLTAPLLGRRLLSLEGFSRKLFRSSIAFGMPLIVYELAFVVLVSADRFLINHYLGSDMLGRYSVAYGLAQQVNNLLIAPLNLAIVPIYMSMWTAEGAEKTRRFLSKGLNVFVVSAAGMLAVVAATGRDAVLILASSKYAGAEELMPWLVGGFLIYTTHIFISAGLLIHERTQTMAGLLLASAALNIVLNVLLLPRLGLMAAAIAMVVSHTVCIVLLARASFRLLPLTFDVAALLRCVLAAAVSGFAAAQIDTGTPLWNLALRSAAGCLIYAALLISMDRKTRRFLVQVLRAQIRLKPASEPPPQPSTSGTGLKSIAIGFHDVVDDGAEAAPIAPGHTTVYSLARSDFQLHLDEIRRRNPGGCTSAADLLPAWGSSVPLLLTFDDGVASSYSIVAPELERHGWRGHFFVVTGWIGKPGFLTATQIVDLHRRGHVIGTHSASHPARMSSMEDADLLREWEDSAWLLGNLLGEPVVSASLPNGFYSERVAKAAASAGIRILFTSDPRSGVRSVDGCLVVGRYAVQAGTPPPVTGGIAAGARGPRWRQYAAWEMRLVAKRLAGSRYAGIRRFLWQRGWVGAR